MRSTITHHQPVTDSSQRMEISLTSLLTRNITEISTTAPAYGWVVGMGLGHNQSSCTIERRVNINMT
ncbi:hypothetical protein AFLA_009287 [Aspergillus flavus NRRL3357]|nr:hypothetical protein AFLA_009287 [Aspergillus flavus NRRL3357]